MATLSLFNNKTQALHAELGTIYFAVRDARTPWPAKLAAILVVAYALSPIDLIPDFIPFIGWIDDFLIIGLGMRVVRYLTPPVVWAESKAKAEPVESYVRSTYRRVIRMLIAFWIALVLLSVVVVVFLVRWIISTLQ